MTAWTATPSDTVTVTDGVAESYEDTLDYFGVDGFAAKVSNPRSEDYFGLQGWPRSEADLSNKTLSVSDTVTITDSSYRRDGKAESDSVTLTDSHTEVEHKGGGDIVTVFDDNTKAVGKLETDIVLITDIITTHHHIPGTGNLWKSLMGIGL